MYNKDDAVNVGKGMHAVFNAAKDGVQVTQDMPVVMDFMTKLLAAANEFGGNAAAASMHAASGLTDSIGDELLAADNPDTPA